MRSTVRASEDLKSFLSLHDEQQGRLRRHHRPSVRSAPEGSE